MTRAVVEALRERIQRAEFERPHKVTAEDLHEIGRKFRRHCENPGSSLDHGELLYDEYGLPR
ncbi:MAG: transcription factor [Alphaproteobacteria bacterium]|nr:transcription factor [Alphaproteobacteria bacterium]